MRFQLGPWSVQPDMDSIVCDGQASHISPKAMEVLQCLARRQGHVVAKDEIIKEVWGETFVSDDSLTRCIGELRRAFHDGAHEPSVIRTIPKRGYLLLPTAVWDRCAAPVPKTTSAELDGAHLPDQAQPSSLPSTPEAGSAATLGASLSRIRMRHWLAVAVSLVCVTAILLALSSRRKQTGGPASGLHTIRSIAVLPLANLSGDPEQEYFADGMTDELITELAQNKACDVISRTSVMRFKGTKLPLREIGRELSVDSVLEGTVLRSGTRVRITVQLIDAQTDRHLWAGSFERDMTDVLLLQGDIARTVAGQLNIALSAPGQDQSRSNRKVVPEAYDAYLRGWYFFDRAQYAKSASYFEQATVADPTFALAHALLCEADAMASFSADLPPSDRALRAMARARELDDSLAEVRDAVGDVMMFERWDWQAGEAEYRRAIELDPASVDAALHYVYSLHVLTKWQLAEQQLKRALRVDPVSPAVNLAWLRLLVDTHRFEPALVQFQRVVELDPNSSGAYNEMVTVYAAMGREDDAVSAFLKAETLSGASPEEAEALNQAAAQGGFQACLKRRVEQMQQRAPRSRVSALVFAALYARIGNKDQALSLLEEAYQQRLPRIVWIKARAVWDPLRPDPRFQSLLRRMRFPE